MKTLNSMGTCSVILLLLSCIWSRNDEDIELEPKENAPLKQNLQGSWFYSRSFGGMVNAPYLDSSYFESKLYLEIVSSGTFNRSPQSGRHFAGTLRYKYWNTLFESHEFPVPPSDSKSPMPILP